MQKVVCETQNFYILLAFLLITIALLIAVSIYCYLIKYWAKPKHLLLFNVKRINQEKFYINECIIKMESNQNSKKLILKIARDIISMT